MTTTITPAVPVTVADRCDRCGARAAIRVMLPSGSDLLFCGHHAKAYDEKLREIASDIVGN